MKYLIKKINIPRIKIGIKINQDKNVYRQNIILTIIGIKINENKWAR